MNREEIIERLRAASSRSDFTEQAYKLTEAWDHEKDGIDAVEPILLYMEQNPTLDFGTPGPLVHFVERFYGQGYEGKLIDSLCRRPTPHTVWMLNRVINGTKDAGRRIELIGILRAALDNPIADS